MISKLSATKIAHRAGCGVTIGSGQDAELFNKLLAGESVGTYFAPSAEPIKSHKRWIAIQDHTHGTLTVDAGAASAIQQSGKSLLSAGIVNCEGDFEEGDVVKICTADGSAIAHGLAAINYTDLSSILAHRGDANQSDAANHHSSAIVHRDHLVLLD
jgi:glutamate 5-kinase